MSELSIPGYNFKEIEKKWKEKWETNKLYQVDLDKAKKPFYNLMMFPYPSAEGLHIGGVYTFTGVDTFGRFKKMQGYNVFEPIGLDGFGIHSENYAMKIGEHIKEVSKRTEKNFYRQLSSIGNMYDWSRTVETYKPEYYKWTQWLFLKLFNKGLAYQKKAKVNWCPWCKTVLSDEQVIQGQCERCESLVEKKELKQWFFKITDYADRLLKNLDWIDWSEDVKTNQRNWIGKSEGARVNFKIKNSKEILEVFTTRPDTLFGVTYMVLAPEHELIEKSKNKIENWEEVKAYIEKAKSKSELERREEEKVKTGRELKGIKAINPVNGEKIPIWIADYVLAGYGTGAIMAVPAHDERDFEFAKKFDIEIKTVVAPLTVMTGEGSPKNEKNIVCFDGVTAIIKHWEEDKYFAVEFKTGQKGFVGGRVEKDESHKEAIMREVIEESGYEEMEIEEVLFEDAFSRGYKSWKSQEEFCHEKVFVLKLKSDKRRSVDDKNIYGGHWLSSKEISDSNFFSHHKYYLQMHIDKNRVFNNKGISINSGFLDGLKTDEAKAKMIEWLEEKGLGEKSTDYKLRDWCVSRQRYWGPPIPIIWCEECGKKEGLQGAKPIAVPEKDLPVELPDMEDFLPEGKGKGPLAKNEDFVNTTCPDCGASAKRETDVSDPFVDSAWYFLRYPSTEFNNEAINKERSKKWLPADSYIGGKEHTVLHLLYSRFITMVLKDLGHIEFEEPYKRFFGHGLITKDGAKMSKSKGNVISPDDMIEKYGVDVVRLYLRFLGDFSQGGDWRDNGAEGMARFVKKLWQTFFDLKGTGKGVQKTQMIDKTIKVIGEDLGKLSFNTAVARYMEFVNWIRENSKDFNRDQAQKIKETLALVLAPMAPHIAEEFWKELGNDQSIFVDKWPIFNKDNLEDDQFELVVQINGKVRDKVAVPIDISEDEAKRIGQNLEKIKMYSKGKTPKKVIYIQGKLINIVI